jgi:CHAD domain-containing protein
MARAKRKPADIASRTLLFPSAPGSDGAPEPKQEAPWQSRVVAIARGHLDRFTRLGPKVLKGNSRNAIHDIRVASRRLQQVLDLLYPSAPPKLRKLRRAVRRCRRALSTVRNHDVLLSRAERTLRRKRLPRREAWESFHEYLDAERERGFRKAARRVSKLDLPAVYLRLREHLAALGSTAAPRWSAGHSGPAARDSEATWRSQMEAALRQAWSTLQDGVSKAQQERNAASLHGVRLATKKARYLIEVLHQLHTPGSEQALHWLRRVQRQLGDWHDLEILEEAMLAMVAESGMLQERLELAMEVERLVLQNRKRKRSYEARFFQMSESSGEWERLGNWVQDYLGALSSGPRRIGARGYSAALPPSSS